MTEPQVGKIYVIHENGAWMEPLRAALRSRRLPYKEWFLADGTVDLDAPPPAGVFYNRMSASSYTRDHRFGPELAFLVLSWLERHGRRVVNNSRAVQLEVNKAAQYAALNSFGIRTPRTIAVAGRACVPEAVSAFAPGPVILKPNRGGKGHGVHLFDTVDALRSHVASDAYEEPVDGVVLLQEYVRAPEPFITRVEFIGGRFHYAVRVDTSDGFDLCPADACRQGDAACPVGEETAPLFTIHDDVNPSLVKSYQEFLAANGIEVAGVEFIVDETGRIYTYDVNTNTNYNADAEAQANRSGMGELARFLGAELDGVRTDDKRAVRLAM